MRILLLASAAIIGMSFTVPAFAMPIAVEGISASTQVTQVRMRHHRHHMRHHMRRSRSPDNLARGLPGTGPAHDMSKTNGGRANDR